MKNWLLLVLLTLLLCGCVRGAVREQTVPAELNIDAKPPSHQLLVLPDDGKQQLVNMITAAHKSIDMVAYEFEDDDRNDSENIAAVLRDAKNRGLAVRVLINGFDKANRYEKWAKDFFEKNKITYRVASSKFIYTHQKTLIIDGEKALIGTFNFIDTKNRSYFGKTRDFGIVTSDYAEVNDVIDLFNADWENAVKSSQYTPKLKSDTLVCSPVNAREQLTALVKSSGKTLYIYQQELGDLNAKGEGLCREIAEAAARGVDVRVICSDLEGNLRAADYLRKHKVQVKEILSDKNNLYIHAKVYIVDGQKAELGSINMTSVSLDRNRELGIIVKNPEIINRLTGTFNTDWQVFRKYN